MLAPSDYGTQWKVVLIGAASTGKTSILRRLVFGAFPEDVTTTLGAALSTYEVKKDNTNIHMNIWDTAGQESYRSLARLYYRDAKAAVVVFDVCSVESFKEVEFWIGELDVAETFGHYVVIVGNKIDNISSRVISQADGEALAQKSGAVYMEASAKEGTGIKEIFDKIAEHFIQVQASSTKSNDEKKLVVKNSSDGCC